MPLQRSYDVTCVEGGDAPKPAHQKRPKSWILPLITFFVLAVVILLLCLVFWRQPNYKSDAGKEFLHGKQTENVTGVNQTSNTGPSDAYKADKTTQRTTAAITKISTDKPIKGSKTESTTENNTEESINDIDVREAIVPAAATTTPESTTVESTEKTIIPVDEHTEATITASTAVKITEKLVISRVGNTETTPASATVETTEETTISTDEATESTAPASTTVEVTILKSTATKSDEKTTISTDEPTDSITPTLTTVEVTTLKFAEAKNSEETTISTGEATESTAPASTMVEATTLKLAQAKNSEETTISTDEAAESTAPASTTVEVTTLKLAEAKNSEETTISADEAAESTASASTTVEVTTLKLAKAKNSEETTISTDEATESTAPASTTVEVTTLKSTAAKSDEKTTISADEATESTALTSTMVEVTTLKLAEAKNSEETTISTDEATESTAPASTTVEVTTLTSAVDSEDNLQQFGSRIASRMLFYMNHSADACEDFYEYACGGFEGEHLRSETDLAEQAVKRIFDQANKDGSSGQPKQFLDYYKSCLSYNKTFSKAKKIEFVKEAIAEVGKFYTETEWNDDYLNVADILSKLLLRNSAPVFDITPDVAVDVQESCADPAKPARFTLKLGPSMLESNFYEKKKERDCESKLRSEMLKNQVDLNSLYKTYATCKNNLPNLIESVKEVLGQVSHLNVGEIHDTTFTIEQDLRPAFPWLYSLNTGKYITKEEVRKIYVTKEYQLKKIEDLQNGLDDSSFLDWTRLLQTLESSTTESQQTLQVYFFKEILEGLNELCDKQARPLHNALVALYAHKMYYEFVESPPDVEDYCKRTAIRLMPTQASSLYMSSFSPKEHEDIRATVTDIFQELKTTLMSGVKNETWLKNTDDAEIVKKIRDLEIDIPDLSHFQDNHGVKTTGGQVKTELTGNFFKDTLTLEKRNRESMYGVLGKSPIDQKQIWTYFGRPYDTTGSAIHGLNRILMPYGVVDWPAVWSAEKVSARHLILATLGTRIASLIAHHFDSTGIKYFADTKNTDKSAIFCSDDDSAEDSYKSYIEAHQTHNDPKGKIHLPSTGQDVEYAITDLGQLETLPLKMGLQLAYNTMSRLRSDTKKLLPWLTNEHDILVNENERKQFFLAYAQTQCTNVPLTSTFVSLYEDGNLPSKLRVLETASSIEAVGKTWSCRRGAPVFRENIPSAFPDLKSAQETQQVEAFP